MSLIDPREFGRLEEQVAALKTQQEDIAVTLAEMRKELRSVSDMITTAKGGWRTMMMVGGAAASVAALVSWVVDHVSIK